MGRPALKFVGRDRKCQERKDTETMSERKRHKEAGRKNRGKTCVIMWEQESQITDYEPTLHSAWAIRDSRPQTRKRENYTSSLFKSLLRKWGTSLSLLISFLPSLLCAAATAVFAFPLSFCEDKTLENAVITVPPSLPSRVKWFSSLCHSTRFFIYHFTKPEWDQYPYRLQDALYTPRLPAARRKRRREGEGGRVEVKGLSVGVTQSLRS